MAKKQSNGASGAPKKAGPPEGALFLRHDQREAYERLTPAELLQAKAQQKDEHDKLEATRKQIADLKGKLKIARENEAAHTQRFEGLSLEVGSESRKVDATVALYLHTDGKVRPHDLKTYEVVGEEREPTDEERQGGLYPDAPSKPGRGAPKALPPKSASHAPYDLETTGEGLDEDGGAP